MSTSKKKSSSKKNTKKKTVKQPVLNVEEKIAETVEENVSENARKPLDGLVFSVAENQEPESETIKKEPKLVYSVSESRPQPKFTFTVEETKEEKAAEKAQPAEKKRGRKPKTQTAEEKTSVKPKTSSRKKKETSADKTEEKKQTEKKKKTSSAKKQPAKKTSNRKKKKEKKEEPPKFVITDYSLKTEQKRGWDLDFTYLLLSFIVLLVFVMARIEIKVPEYEKRGLPEEFNNRVSKLVISEVCTSNNGFYADENGNVSDFIEIYNGTDKDINLKGYGLSDKKNKFKFEFGDTTIKAGQYLTVSLSGNNSPETLEAGFRLSSKGGEKVIFISNDLVVIDSIKTVSMNTGSTMAIDERGRWYISDKATPGFENSASGYSSYLDSLIAEEENDLIINELLARNKGNWLADSDSGFVELKNISDHEINLADYFISDDRTMPFKRKLDDTVLKPGQLYVLSFDEKSDEFACAGFNPKKNGILTLAKSSGIISSLNYISLSSGQSYQYCDGSYHIDSVISPGFENDGEGISSWQQKQQKPEGLIINEVMKKDSQYLKIDDEYFDWIELYNNSSEDINLAEYTISDSMNDPEFFRLPEITLAAGQYYTLISEKKEIVSDKYVNTGFNLSDYCSIYLYHNGEAADCVFTGILPFGYSYGRSDEGGFGYISKPTLNKANNSAVAAVSYMPEITTPSGKYEDVDSVTVTINGAGDIYYTLDGNTPDRSSKKYSGEITLTRTTVVKAVSYQNGKAVSETATSSYIINEHNTLPIVSVSIDTDKFNSINTYYRAEDYRKQGYVEYFDTDGTGFAQKCGIGLFGDDSRKYRKKNYVFKFTKEFGAESVHYPVFENRENTDYSTLSIRAGGQDWTDSIIRDHLMTELVDEYTDVLTFASKTVVVYINGKYWGLYTLREKKSGSFFEDNYNIDADSLNLMLSCGEVERGSSKDYVALRKYINSHNLANDEYYNYVCEHIDVVQWADFWIAHTYCANVDCFNIRYYQSPEINDGKWMCLFYDLDWGMSTEFGPDYNFYGRYLFAYQFPCHFVRNGVRTVGIENDIIRNLFKNQNFRQLWLERLKYNLENTWNRDIVLAKIDSLQAEYETEIVRNQNRWDHSVTHWRNSLDDLRYFVRNRQYYLLRQTKNYFDMTDAQMKEIFGDLYK